MQHDQSVDYCQTLFNAVMYVKEQERASEAEERARRLAATHEERVANLEAKLAELSQTVGNYDRLRQNDQGALQKLRVFYNFNYNPFLMI